MTEPNKATTSTKEEEATAAKKWGTHVMGPPAVPTVHPDNQKAASWSAAEHQEIHQQPYVQYSPVEKHGNSPFESVCHMFDHWSKNETVGRNIWHNLRTGPSLSETAWGKMNLTAKVLSQGGYESLFKQIFEAEPNERLNKTFACYLSTTTGPVAGTIYLSTSRMAFCSDRPLSFIAPSGQEAWSYYKVSVPLGNIGTVNPVIMKENPPEKYIQVVTIDGHQFWFMGFVNFEKATHHLLSSVSEFRAAGSPAAMPPAGAMPPVGSPAAMPPAGSPGVMPLAGAMPPVGSPAAMPPAGVMPPAGSPAAMPPASGQ